MRQHNSGGQLMISSRENESGFKKATAVIASTITLLVIGLVVLYFIWWRPSSDDFTKATTDIDTLQAASSSVAPTLESIESSSDITADVVARLTSASDAFNKSYKSLSESKATLRDARVSEAYTSVRSSIDTYASSLTKLSDSVSALREMLDTCDELWGKLETIANKSDYDSASKDCVAAIDATENAPDVEFNSSVISPYRSGFNTFVTASGQYFESVDNGSSTTAANAQLRQAGETVASAAQQKFEYSFTPEEAPSLGTLASVIKEQQSAFLR